MKYRLRISERVEKDFDKIPGKEVKKILEKIRALSLDPFPVGNKKITSSEENLYRIRQGSYRILYVIEEQIKVVEVRKVGHRKDIYKNK